MLRKADCDVLFHDLAEIGRGELPHFELHVFPGLILRLFGVDSLVDFGRQVETARELRIAGIPLHPRAQRFVRVGHFIDNIRIDRRRPRADGLIPKRVVNSEVTQFETAEILVSRRRLRKTFAFVALKFARHSVASVLLGRRSCRRRIDSRNGRRACAEHRTQR